jgi:hypothetical protein
VPIGSAGNPDDIVDVPAVKMAEFETAQGRARPSWTWAASTGWRWEENRRAKTHLSIGSFAPATGCLRVGADRGRRLGRSAQEH